MSNRGEIISSFSGVNGFLSNFHEEEFDCAGMVVKTAEHAFQAQKMTTSVDRQAVLLCKTPGIAKRVARKLPMRDDWDERRVRVMRAVLRHKFAEGSVLAQRLVTTHPAVLVEGNTWGDRFWGCERENGIWIGANTLGILLMERRAELRGDNDDA